MGRRWWRRRRAPGNGSVLPAGLVLAATSLRDRVGDRRVILFTDDEPWAAREGRLREASAQLDAGVVVHGVVTRGASQAVDEVVNRHGGVVERPGEGGDEGTLAALIGRLVRPTSLEECEAHHGAQRWPCQRVFGGGERVWRVYAASVERVTGRIGHERVTYEVSEGEGSAWARAVAAVAAWRVEDALAYVVSALGLRPGGEALRVRVRDVPRPVLPLMWYASEGEERVAQAVNPVLLKALGPARAPCLGLRGQGEQETTIRIYTHGREISDVELLTPPSAYAECVVDAAWRIALDAGVLWAGSSRGAFNL